jgi:hypothetical protein
MIGPPRGRSARLRWFQRADITGIGGEPKPPGRTHELENSVNQAFRRWLPRPNSDSATMSHLLSNRFTPILSARFGHRPSSAGAGAG